jgi:hypothetical protein
LGEIPNIGSIRDNYDFYNSKLPIELDTMNTNNKNSFSASGTFKKELFLNSCINIVTETSFVNNELFISEKVLKPILMYQPFIVLGPYQYLNQLKKHDNMNPFPKPQSGSYKTPLFQGLRNIGRSKEAEAFEGKNVKAAAARARKALGELGKLTKSRRMEIQEKKNAL